MKNHFFFCITTWLLITCSISHIWAVQTLFTEYKTEEQFKQGEPNGVMITSQGTILLARKNHTLLDQIEKEWIINAILTNGDTLYAATSGQGKIYAFKLTDGTYASITPECQPTVIYGDKPEDARHIFALAVDNQGRLMAGTGGDKATLLQFDTSGAIKTLWTGTDIQYIWSIVSGPAGRIYLATGPTGKVITLESDGSNEQVLYQASHKNMLCLALGTDGLLYAGGDEYGLIYRIDPSTKKTVVLYDAGHQEISRLLFDPQNNLYAATGDAGISKPGSHLLLKDNDPSRPEPGSTPADIPADIDLDADVPNKLPLAATRIDPDKSQAGGQADSPAGDKGQGNEIFKISPDGTVASIFKCPVTILSLALDEEQNLLIGAGSEGELIRLNPLTQEAAVLYDDPTSAQVSALCGPDSKGSIILGLANPAGLKVIARAYQNEGYYLSNPLDAQQVSRWGILQSDTEIPQDTTLSLQTRSGNTADPKKGGWQEWSAATPIQRLNTITSVPGRFLQFKLILHSANGQQSPTVREIKLASQIPNLTPQIKNLSVEPKPKEAPRPEAKDNARTMTFVWEAEDRNEDELVYDIFIRPLESARWVALEKDVEEPRYELNSLLLADGHYELKVAASDRGNNPAGSDKTAHRISQPFIIDNTPPEIMELTWQTDNNQVRVEIKVQDRLSVIHAVDYVVDGHEPWHITLPADQIFDHSEETIHFTLTLEEAGEHLLSIRVKDSFDNAVYRNIKIAK